MSVTRFCFVLGAILFLALFAYWYESIGVLIACLTIVVITAPLWAFSNSYKLFDSPSARSNDSHEPIVLFKEIGAIRYKITIKVQNTAVPNYHQDKTVWQGVLNSFIPRNNEEIEEGVKSTIKKYTDNLGWSVIDIEVNEANS